jgi:hypothetical protein
VQSLRAYGVAQSLRACAGLDCCVRARRAFGKLCRDPDTQMSVTLRVVWNIGPRAF